MGVNVRQVDGSQNRIAIDGEMTIYTAMELKDKLLSPLEQCEEMEVDLAGVSEIDSAGIQLLALTKTETMARGKTLRITGHSPAVLEILGLCDLEGFFGDPVLIRSPE